RQVLSGGARVLQYRNKLSSPVVRFEQASALRQLTQEFGVPLIINDDAQLAQQVDADGVHLGGEDGSIAAARQVLGFDKIIGVSCYNRLSLAQQDEGLGADYVAFGAFFASTVKPRARVAELPLLQEARRVIKLPVVAIGGITLENGASVLEAGADALAVISALFSAPDITLAARQFANLNTQSSV
ncbi:MAG: thiamine-phosphate diphosphorylase, partial [Gallionellales bacterium RIFOXYD12_FULL_53_10]